MTPILEETLEFIRRFIEREGYPPTIREIMRGCGLKSPCPVQDRLDRLQQLGKITFRKKQPRTIKLTGYQIKLVSA